MIVRTCIVCRKTGQKEAFFRVIRTPSGIVKKAETVNENGRGAYLCRTAECIQKAFQRKKKDALSYHLKIKVDPNIEKELLYELQHTQ